MSRGPADRLVSRKGDRKETGDAAKGQAGEVWVLGGEGVGSRIQATLDKRAGWTEGHKPPSEQLFDPFRTLRNPLSPAARASSLAIGPASPHPQPSRRPPWASLLRLSPRYKSMHGSRHLGAAGGRRTGFWETPKGGAGPSTLRGVGGARRAHPNRGDW